MNRLISRSSTEQLQDETRLLFRLSQSKTCDQAPEAIVELHNLQHAAQQASSESINTEFEALQEAKSAQQLAHSAHLAILQLKRDIEAKEEHKRSDELRNDATKKGQRAHWFPWLAVALMMNLLLWLSMLYFIFKVEDYVTQRSRFLITAWAIFMAPLLVFALLLLSPYPSLLKQRRNDTATQAPSSNYRAAINIFNALCCFTLVVVYLYDSAFPQYTTPKWQAGVVFEENLMVPAFAYLLNPMQFQPVDFPESSLPCRYANQSGSLFECPSSAMGKTPTRLYLDEYRDKNSSAGWDRLAYIFNSSELPLLESVVRVPYFCGSGQTVKFRYLTLRSLAKEAIDANDATVEAVLLDPRINLTDAIGCGLV